MTKDSDSPDRLPAGGLYPIRTVAAVTGVNPVTLRAWERRYNLLRPTRTPKGHRLYTREQIETIGRVTQLLDQGIAISQVKPLLGTTTTPLGISQARNPPAIRDPWNEYIDRILDGVARFDTWELDAVYSEVLSLHPMDALTQRVLIPVLERLGSSWKTAPAGIGQEHFFSAFLRNKIGARIHHLGVQCKGPRLVAACLPNEPHDIGLLLFSHSAMMRGYRILYLGANMPLEQLPVVMEQSAADALVLSSHLRPRNGLLSERLPLLAQRVEAPVFIGGPASVSAETQLQAAGLIPLGTDHDKALQRIADTLSG